MELSPQATTTVGATVKVALELVTPPKNVAHHRAVLACVLRAVNSCQTKASDWWHWEWEYC